MLFTVDPHPSLIEHDGEFCILPNTAVLCVNKQVREEAMETIRNRNTWVALEVNSRDGDLDALPYRELLSNQALIPHAWMDNLRLFVQRRSVVIAIGVACGGRGTRPVQRPYTSVRFLLTYNRQGFTYLCLRLWQCAAMYNDMTVILNMPRTSRNALIIRSIISELSHIRGLRHAACIGFPNVQQAQHLERRMMTNNRTWKNVFEHLRWLRNLAESAVVTSMYEEAIHRCRIACLTSDFILQSVPGSLVGDPRFRNACIRISTEFFYKKCAAILVFTSRCSDKRFVGLSEQLIEEAVQAANRALLGFPGMYNDYRVRAYELRVKAFKVRAAYRNHHEAHFIKVRSDLNIAALDYYFASIHVDRIANPGVLPMDNQLQRIEHHLRRSRQVTRDLAETELFIDAHGARHVFDRRLLRFWELTARQLMDVLPILRWFPPPSDTVGLL